MKIIHRILNYFGYRLVTIKAGAGLIYDEATRQRHAVGWRKFTKIISNNRALVIDRFGSKFTKEKGLTDYRECIVLLK